MKFKKFALVSCAMSCLFATQTHADNLKVYSPRVEKGEIAAEANLNYNFDHRDDQDNYFSQVIGMEYSPTSFWKTELSGEVEKENGSENKLTNIKWENVISPWKPNENIIDAALYVELETATQKDEPNNFEAKILLEKEINNFVNTGNIITSHEFGTNSGNSWNYGLNLRSKYKLDQKLEPGIEYYGDFGSADDNLSFDEQGHSLGPVIQGKIGKVKYDTGILLGISDAAPDTTAKLNLEYEF